MRCVEAGGMNRMYFYLSLFLALLMGSAVPALPDGAEPLKISYSVDVRSPQAHLFRIGLDVEKIAAPSVDFAMPAWLPGYNKILDLAKNVQEFEACDGKGNKLKFFKLDKQTWRVLRGSDDRLRITYKVFANNLANINISSHLDETHAFFNGAAVFLYVVGAKDRPVSLEILKRDDWRIATGMEKAPGPGIYRAPNYDSLIDCPTEIGAFTQYDFSAEGIPHHIVLYGLRDIDASTIVPDISRIVEACARLFGELPYREYTFIYHLTDRERRSGVEHANSTAIIFNQQDFHSRRKYDDFLNVTAHEYFHLWNIKRIRPSGWGPFDYTREAYTKSHWFTEGMTSYYAGLILVRSGLWSREKFYLDMASKLTEYENSPGKHLMSLEQASWDIWLKPDNAPHTTVSYYVKGAVVGFMLDLEIRKQSAGRKSLDDVMRLLDAEYGQSNKAYQNEDLLRAINRVSGGDFSRFYGKYVGGTDRLALEESLSFAGLKLIEIKDPAAPSLGIEIRRTSDGLPRVHNVAPGSTGSEAGLDSDDIILALDNERVTFDNWQDLLARLSAGAIVSVTLYHRDCLMKKSVTVGSVQKSRYVIQDIDPPSREHLLRRQELFGGGPAGRVPAAN